MALATTSVVSSAIAAAEGAWVEKRYDVAGLAPIVLSAADPIGLSGDGSLEAGGVVFDALPGTGFGRVEVRVDDDVSPYIGWTVCQDETGLGGVCSGGPSGVEPGKMIPVGLICDDNHATHEVLVERGVPIIVQVWGVAACASITYSLIPFPVFDGVGFATSGTVSLREMG